MMTRTFTFLGLVSGLMLLVNCDSDSTTPVVIDDQQEAVKEDPGKEASTCYPAFEEDELNVATWNIEFFPMNGNASVTRVRDLIEDLDADIIAVQEINDVSKFEELGEDLIGWEAVYSDVRFSLEIGYLYKKSAFTSFSELTQLFGDDSNAFPREVVRADATHISGLEVTLMNIHLKCCGGSGSSEQMRREAASMQMKSYIDDNLSDRAVIVLGDFNDGITEDDTPFLNFIDDPNFRFADQEVAESSTENWSYPSWPSHLDHILISDELFDEVRNVQTIMAEDCVDDYASIVSDHRPVLASFK